MYLKKYLYTELGICNIFSMEIHELKNKLEITQVAQELGIEINKDGKACCPFHDDKTPSLQFSKEKQIATCFSSRCDAGTMDVIKLTEKKLNSSTHEALKYLSDFVGERPLPQSSITLTNQDYHKDFEVMKSSFLSSSVARDYAESRCLDRDLLAIGYNAFKNSRFNYLRGCITFGLRDASGKVVSMYGRSVRDNDKAKHYYTSNHFAHFPLS